MSENGRLKPTLANLRDRKLSDKEKQKSISRYIQSQRDYASVYAAEGKTERESWNQSSTRTPDAKSKKRENENSCIFETPQLKPRVSSRLSQHESQAAGLSSQPTKGIEQLSRQNPASKRRQQCTSTLAEKDVNANSATSKAEDPERMKHKTSGPKMRQTTLDPSTNTRKDMYIIKNKLKRKRSRSPGSDVEHSARNVVAPLPNVYSLTSH